MIRNIVAVVAGCVLWTALWLRYHASFLILLVPEIVIGARNRNGRPVPGGTGPGATP